MPNDETLIGRVALEWGLISMSDLVQCQWELGALRAQGRETCLEQIMVRRGLLAPTQLPDLVRETAWRASGPEVLERYDIERSIGEGGMGRVYRVVDRARGGPAALKLLKTDKEVHRKRFLREAKVVSRLCHPHIVRIHEAGEAAGRLYMVLEWVEGMALSETLETCATRQADLIVILEKVARGVQHAHEHGIVHRDLKPGNIVIDPKGEPKVLDFGLAYLGDAGTVLTRAGARLGTPLYMAPEQVTATRESFSPATDVYALGAILYEILTGRSPHAGQRIAEIYDAIVNVPPIPPGRIAPGTPPGLARTALRALEKDPARRHASAREFANELREHLQS